MNRNLIRRSNGDDESDIEFSALYLLEDARAELIYIDILGEEFNYIELAMEYSYTDEEGTKVIQPIAPLCLDRNGLVELSSIIAMAMADLRDANPLEFVGWYDEDEDDEL